MSEMPRVRAPAESRPPGSWACPGPLPEPAPGLNRPPYPAYQEVTTVINPSFDVYRLTDEHTFLRQVVRELAEDRIAPRAAEIDSTEEFPWDVYAALRQADLHATHIPEEYGGVGADSIATCIV